MTRHKSVSFLTLLALTFSVELVMGSGFLTPVEARTQTGNRPGTTSRQDRDRVTLDPPGEGVPDDTAGGASRAPRNDGIEGIGITAGRAMVLTPSPQERRTISDRPTFLIYVPNDRAKQIFFSLKDENDNHLYQTKINLDGKSGIVSFPMPAEAPALETGKNYHWGFAVLEEEGLKPDTPIFEGKIQRTELAANVKQQLETASAVEKATVYKNNGIGYDALAALALEVRSQPNNSAVATAWTNILKSAGWEAIATKPVL